MHLFRRDPYWNSVANANWINYMKQNNISYGQTIRIYILFSSILKWFFLAVVDGVAFACVINVKLLSIFNIFLDEHDRAQRRRQVDFVWNATKKRIEFSVMATVF